MSPGLLQLTCGMCAVAPGWAIDQSSPTICECACVSTHVPLPLAVNHRGAPGQTLGCQGPCTLDAGLLLARQHRHAVHGVSHGTICTDDSLQSVAVTGALYRCEPARLRFDDRTRPTCTPCCMHLQVQCASCHPRLGQASPPSPHEALQQRVDPPQEGYQHAVPLGRTATSHR
jgi:hypothetical protein